MFKTGVYKGGQVTVYITLSLFVLAVIAVFFYSYRGSPLTVGTGADSVNIWLDSCFDQAAQTAVLESQREGLADESYTKVMFWNGEVPFFVNGENSKVPSLSEAHSYISSKVLGLYEQSCNLGEIEGISVVQSFGSGSASSEILDDGIIVSIDVPTKVYAQNKELLVKRNRAVRIKSDLKRMIGWAESIANAFAARPGFIPIDALALSPYDVYLHPTYDSDIIVRVMDINPKNSINEEPQILAFGVRE